MVAKIGRGKNLIGALIYNHEKVKKGKGSVLFCHKMIEPIQGSFTTSLFARSFEPYLIANKKTEKPILHISLNPTPKDTVSDERFQQIAEHYMKKMGYGEQPYVVFKHTDIDRTHIHIVSVCVDENGKRISDSFEKRRSMKVCRNLEQKFGLLSATKKEKKGKVSLKKVDPKRPDVKWQIANVLTFINDGYHFQTLGEYKALLSLFHITAEEVKGEIHGKEKKGLVYMATDGRGKKASSPFKSSRFAKPMGWGGLQKRMAASKAHIQKTKPQKKIRETVKKAMQNSKDRKAFEKRLSKEGITAFIRENKQGRIYGITFIDHRSKTVLNGSRLGKGFAANVFHRWWKEYEPPQLTAEKAVTYTSPFTENSGIEKETFIEKGTSAWESLGGLLLPDYIPEDTTLDYPKKKKRKKKKNAKRR